MNHPDKYKAKRYDVASHAKRYTDAVYNSTLDAETVRREMREAGLEFLPPEPSFKPFTGEMHGHTDLSDGRVDIDSYFRSLRDVAKLDFAALTDHDHGGVGKPTLWYGGKDSKWELTKKKVKEYREDGKFTTILAYERDSYPFFCNLVLYFRNDDADMILDERPGELTEACYRKILADPDIIAVPHDTYDLHSNGDFLALDPDLIPPFMEIISRGDPAEYMGNPGFGPGICCEGGFYQDALGRGAKIGVIGGSDDHRGGGGLCKQNTTSLSRFPGVTGVWAEENTHKAIFDALVAKRTYAYMLGEADGEMGGRMEIDFRINNHWMGETIRRPANGDIRIYFNVKADVPVKCITVVKNCRNCMMFKNTTQLIFDYKQENDTDSYYLRVELADGRFGWTTPVWVERS